MSLLDDLDKELNNYIMRCREWYVGVVCAGWSNNSFSFRYGWHFPELGKIITDNLAFVRTIDLMGVQRECLLT